MLGRTYGNQNCSAARALEAVGERWSLLIIRDAMFGGVTRYTDFQRNLGIAPNILAARLDGFVEAGLMRTRQYSDQHREYLLTDKGWDLQPAIIALTEWGDRWAAPAGPPAVYRHRDCGGHVQLRTHCSTCGQTPPPAQVAAHPGPGRDPAS
ncbi:winged helix-turn-helix transcriptional regulator [Pseudonocardia acaciae]|uniref:winged helix-turn-helix transcriptional regulator n=1 Tax=Pseudonocardia acaciae TaxID=551276 RepID=UPI00048DBEF5|nr:helix-turn-helix domain-containing protein [Pseudonocardia acaciae]